MKHYILITFFTLTTIIAVAQTNIFPNSGSVGIGTTTPRSILDVAEFIPNGKLGAVFGRLSEGDTNGSGTFLGVRGYSNGVVDGKSFAIEHDFFGLTNSSINFHRGGSVLGGSISFATGTNVESMRITTNGNIGIGTANPENGFKLDVNGFGAIGTSGSTRLYFGTMDQTTSYIQSRDLSINQKLLFYASSYNFDIGNMGLGSLNTLSNTGNKGIQVAKGGHSSIILGDPLNDGRGGIIQTSDNMHRLFLGANLYDDELGNWKNFQTGKGGAGISIVADEGSYGSSIEFYIRKQDGLGSDYSKMNINADGDVGIGTTSPKEKLSVNGKIRAHEVKVETANWPDYVFEEGYKVKTLQELESYIKANKRLPGFPSAKEVETNGVELGDVVKQLLKNQEELTLQLIEQDKQIKLLSQKLKSLSSKN